MSIDIQNRQRRVPGFDTAALRRRAGFVDEAARTEQQVVCITLVSDARIHQLNRDYRGQDKPTDVLSFAQNEGEFAELHNELLGDVLISLETAERQRKDRSLLDEVTHLLIHGVLHLQGHDHQEDDEALVMEGEEKRIWAAVRAAL
jgi:probable rRNA maturation factor